MQTNRRIPRQFILLLIISALPIMIGTSLFHYHAFFNFKTLNQGNLVNPPIKIDDLFTTTASNNEKKWRIVQVVNTTCDEQCKKQEYFLHQIPRTLGKDGQRVSVMLIAGSSPSMQKLQTEFNQKDHISISVENKIYLIDPQNNLFMYYPGSVDPMAIFKDLKRVLEVSQIG